ncbi:MAG: 16S rRNA (cytosine(967)-C(5))-methyltransferase RsmB, partial [Clostridia bacterium]|nr:16S rRNA (cytosine(967)-C(5))-methyltransferase RsmB [Clostridia bacterium]
MAQTARDVAVTALMQWEREQTFSGVMLDALLQKYPLSAPDKALTTTLVYGVLERLLTLDWVLAKHVRQPLKKCHPAVRATLRVGAYQLLFMEKIPPSAAVNEAVAIVKRLKQPYAAGFVNGALRAVSREGRTELDGLSDDLNGFSVRHSVPVALLKAWEKAYGLDHAKALAEAANGTPPSVIRVNTLLVSVEKFQDALKERHMAFSAVEGLPAALEVADAAALRASDVSDAWYYFQDAASQWACETLGAKEGEQILDMCAAPGGKSFTTAMRMNGRGTIVSCDIYAHKTAVMDERAARYGIDCVQTVCRDASDPCPAPWVGRFDRVICDVPCSGFGVIRRRPEIRYKSVNDFGELQALQYRIL